MPEVFRLFPVREYKKVPSGLMPISYRLTSISDVLTYLSGFTPASHAKTGAEFRHGGKYGTDSDMPWPVG